MKIIKVSNILQIDGSIDYKGLDISKFVPNSQVYSQDLTICAVKSTQENMTVNEDIIEIDEAQYEQLKSDFYIALEPTEEQQKIAQLEADNAQMMYALMMGGLI